MVTLELQPTEHLISIYRRSQLALLAPVLASVLAAAIPWWLLERADLTGRYFGFLGLWFLGCTAYLVVRYVNWLLTCLVLTDRRCVLSSREGVFNHKVTEVLLIDLSQVTVTVRGVISALSGTGTVELFSQGSTTPVAFTGLSRPNLAAGEIRRAMARARGANF